jgi:type II secretory pathway component GspD/PulD (secretin)
MRSKIRIIITALILTGACLAPAAAEDIGALTKINFKEQAGKVVLELKGTRRLQYRVKEFDAPPHILVQLFNMKSGLPYTELKVNKGDVADVSVSEVNVNGQTATFVSVHLDRKVDYDFDLSADGSSFLLSTGGGATASYQTGSQGYQSASQSKLPPDINIPGGQPQPTVQIPYSTTPSGSNSNEKQIPARIKEYDTSPYIVGPVILQDTDISQAVRLLSEAAGGANIVVEAALVQQQSTTSTSGGTGSTSAGITVTLSHITLEDALDIITASNEWVWRKYGDYYAIMSKDTAFAGVTKMPSANVFEDSGTQTNVIIVQPKNTYACVIMGQLSTVVADLDCDASANLLFIRGTDRDLNRAREMLSIIDVPTKTITRDTSTVTKIIRLKYITINGDFTDQLGTVIANPYFGGIKSGTGVAKDTLNSISYDTPTNSIIFVGEQEIYDRFFNLIQGMDVPERTTIIRTIPLKYINVKDLAGNMEPITSLIGATDKLIPSYSTNSLIYLGTESGYDRIISVIRGLDVEDRQYVTFVFHPQYINVNDLYNSSFFTVVSNMPGFGGGETGSAADSSTKITNVNVDFQTNSVIITTQKQFADALENLLKSFDTSIFSQYKEEMIYLKYIPAAKCGKTIASMIGTSLVDADKYSSEEVPKATPDGSFFFVNPRIYGEHNSVSGSSSGGSSGSSSSGSYPNANKWVVIPDVTKNALLVMAMPQEMEMIKKVIESLDKPYPQIKLDIQIVQLQKSDDYNYEIAYISKDGKFTTGGNVSGHTSDFSPDLYTNPDISSKAGTFLIYDTLANSVAAFGASLQSTLTKVNGRVIANPTLISPEGVDVYFNFSDEVHYNKPTVVTNASGASSQGFEDGMVNEGFTFTATPHFSGDYVVLKIHISANQIKGTSANGVPIQATREVDTEVKVQDGVPIIIGGMVRSTEMLTRTSYPLVSSIPLIGSLFKKKVRTSEDSEIVMVITPTIMPVE